MLEPVFIWHWRRLVSSPPLWVALIAGTFVLNVVFFFGGMFPATGGASFLGALLLGFASPGLSPVGAECRYLLARPVSRLACLVTWAMVALLTVALTRLTLTLLPWGGSWTPPNMTMVMDANTVELLKAAKLNQMEVPTDVSSDQLRTLREHGGAVFALPGYFAFELWFIVSGIVLGIVARLGAPGPRGAAGGGERFGQAVALYGPALVPAGAWIGLVVVGRATYFTVWGYLHASGVHLVLLASVLVAAAACVRAWMVADVS